MSGGCVRRTAHKLTQSSLPLASTSTSLVASPSSTHTLSIHYSLSTSSLSFILLFLLLLLLFLSSLPPRRLLPPWILSLSLRFKGSSSHARTHTQTPSSLFSIPVIPTRPPLQALLGLVVDRTSQASPDSWFHRPRCSRYSHSFRSSPAHAPSSKHSPRTARDPRLVIPL